MKIMHIFVLLLQIVIILGTLTVNIKDHTVEPNQTYNITLDETCTVFDLKIILFFQYNINLDTQLSILNNTISPSKVESLKDYIQNNNQINLYNSNKKNH